MSNKLVLVLNCGSSSLKFAILDAISGDEKLSGLAECFNLEDARIKWKANGEKHSEKLGGYAAHREAIEFIVQKILVNHPEVLEQLIAVGHRVVHGGEKFTKSVVISQDVINGIEACSNLAPLHNPAALIGIRASQSCFPDLPMVAVFDTAFHQTMPEQSYLYALPYKLYREKGIRRYGMHGTSHLYVANEAAKMLGKEPAQTNVITAHLGNGASLCAVKGGVSVDTTMGLTPLEGLVMGTRSGDIDPAIIFHLVDREGYTLQEVNNMLTNQSGLMGLTETTSDCRFVEDGFIAGDEVATRAMNVFCYRLAKSIAAYAASMDGQLDALVFTGGIGENSAPVRAETVRRLSLLGFEIDNDANTKTCFGAEGEIGSATSRKILVIPTNEELVIASDAAALLA
ncbi:acetate kinase [Alginatibacterium sediminis]|uniref:Acetate kinase n=1 Tax=Alginatibacterium sediminis TaxID=2164068 RepID=A0A420E9Z7_9ALTE|nr:acetate kinase [Alginatibacterium sediminis]RKF17495.1 acetate kinase [Alginatibacterium sediminis]